MHRLSLTSRRLAGLAIVACAAALTPAAALAVTTRTASTPACTTAGLVVWINTQGNGYAGGMGYTLQFTNLSGHTCTLNGFPGVSAVGLTGGQLGKPAGWGGHPGTVTLANGATADATLLVTDVQNFGGVPKCLPVTAAGLRVYPPNQTTSKLIPFPFGACSNPSGPVFLNAQPVT